MHLALIRHTRLQADGLCYGRHDPPLAAGFEAEAQLLASKLADLPKMDFYCSPSLRCRRLAEYLGLQPQYDTRLMELDFGDWEGRAWADIPRDESDAWAANIAHGAPPNGESYPALQARVVAFLHDLRVGGRTHAGLITHAGVIRACLSWLHNIPLEQSFERIAMEYGEIVQLRFADA